MPKTCVSTLAAQREKLAFVRFEAACERQRLAIAGAPLSSRRLKNPLVSSKGGWAASSGALGYW
eukprot:4773075-Amphidinium_carterae.2